MHNGYLFYFWLLWFLRFWFLHIPWLYLKCCYNPVFCWCFYWITTLSLVKYFTSFIFLTTVSSAIPNTVLILSNCDFRVTGRWESTLPWLDPKFWDLEVPFPMGLSVTSKAIILALLYFSTGSLYKLQNLDKSLYLHPTYCCLSSHLEIGASLSFSLLNGFCEVYCLVWLPIAKILLGHKKPYSDHSYRCL